MHNINLPPLERKDTAQDFFKCLLELNKENPDFSHRKFARNIGWPSSLCSDLASGRKQLSLLRAFEFSYYASYSEEELHQMIKLVINDSIPDSYLNHYFKN